MSEERKGLVFAALSAVFLAGVILIAKTLLKTMTPWGFTTFFFGFGAVWYSVYFLIQRDFAVFTPSPAAMKAGLIVGALDAGYTLATFSALQLLTPGVYAFFSHMADLLTVLVGLAILRERFTGKAFVGLGIAFVGLVTLTARTDGVVLEGFLLMLVAAAFFAANAVAIKKLTKVHAPIHLAYYRAIALALLMVVFSLTVVSFRLPRGDEWWLLALVGLIGPFLNYLFFFNALKRLAIGRVSLIRMCYSVLVVIGAYAVYAQLPTDRQIIGGLTLLVGVALVVFERGRAR
ncbi:MAG TPA: DMT family transporter [Kofleriaceae bacterium]|nr:DMT family transporter [Kofleriaceae bacterium]